MSEGGTPLGAGAPLLAVANFFDTFIYPDHTVFAEDAGGGGEPEGFEAFRVANGRRSARDHAKAENANVEWRLTTQMDTDRVANFIAIDRGHNLEGVTVDVEGDDDPNFSSPTTLISVEIPSTVTSPTDLTESPGAKTLEGAWLYFFGNATSFENYRLVVPALGAGLKPKIVGLFIGYAWEPVHASMLSYAPSGPDLALREVVSDSLWAAAGKPIIRRHGAVRIASATSADRKNARTYVERMIWRYRPVWWIPFSNRGEESWLGRVPSGSYAFRRTTEWPLGETTFGLKELEPDTRSVFELPTFIDDTPGAGGGNGGGELTYEITRSTEGLVFEDDFNRADSQSLGNGWTDAGEGAATDIQIVSNQVAAAAVSRKTGGMRPSDEVGDTDDVLVQINAKVNGGNLAGVRLRTGPSSFTAGYNLRADTRSGGSWAIVRDSASIIASSSTNGPSTSTWYGLRGIIEGTVLKLLSTGALANGQDRSEDFTQRTSVDDSAGIVDDANRTGFEHDQLSVSIDYDEFFVCGLTIDVSGIPTGWKIQVDSRSAVTESGGSVSIDIATWALPATTIKLLDDSDVEQATLTPSGGIWGGDVYAVTSS